MQWLGHGEWTVAQDVAVWGPRRDGTWHLIVRDLKATDLNGWYQQCQERKAWIALCSDGVGEVAACMLCRQ